jgi:hypothetical protein
MILMHQIVRASVPLMKLAAAEASRKAGADPVCALLESYLHRHSVEEEDHDLWILQDLATIGIGARDVVSLIPSPQVAALVGAQYYWIHHHHPVALLGYVRLLEGSPPSGTHVDRLQEQSGLPGTLFRTYRLHGELDPNHLRELDSFIDSLPLSDDQGTLIWISASHTARMLARCLEELERTPVELRRRGGDHKKGEAQ